LRLSIVQHHNSLELDLAANAGDSIHVVANQCRLVADHIQEWEPAVVEDLVVDDDVSATVRVVGPERQFSTDESGFRRKREEGIVQLVTRIVCRTLLRGAGSLHFRAGFHQHHSSAMTEPTLCLA
jgi:hypothetical protein